MDTIDRKGSVHFETSLIEIELSCSIYKSLFQFFSLLFLIKNRGVKGIFCSQSIKLEDPGRSEGSREGEIAEGNRYSESEFPKKLDKRQETVLRDLKSYLLTEYATEEEQRQKLRELGVSLSPATSRFNHSSFNN